MDKAILTCALTGVLTDPSQHPVPVTAQEMAAAAREAFDAYLQRRIAQPHFANARSVRNALDRARLRQASRLYADRDRVLSAEDLSTITASDILASRVFTTDADKDAS